MTCKVFCDHCEKEITTSFKTVEKFKFDKGFEFLDHEESAIFCCEDCAEEFLLEEKAEELAYIKDVFASACPQCGNKHFKGFYSEDEDGDPLFFCTEGCAHEFLMEEEAEKEELIKEAFAPACYQCGNKHFIGFWTKDEDGDPMFFCTEGCKEEWDSE